MVTNKLLRFLYKPGNIAGSVLALGGLGMYFTGFIHAYWWEIIFGLYGAGYFAWPQSNLAQRAEQADLPDELLAEHLKRLVDSVVSGLPKDCVACLRRIERILQDLLPRLQQLKDRGSISPQDCFTVTEAIRSYLPNTLAAYLRLPKLYAQNQPLASGHTAAQTLLNQLLLLETSLQAVEKSAFEGDAEQLVINGQFLQNKFSEKLAFRS